MNTFIVNKLTSERDTVRGVPIRDLRYVYIYVYTYAYMNVCKA